MHVTGTGTRIERSGAVDASKTFRNRVVKNRVAMKQTLFLALLAFVHSGHGFAAQKAAVFPFDLRDVEQEGELIPQYKPDDLRRLVLVADELKALLAKDARYGVVDLSAQAAEIEKVSPFSKCDACETPIAAAAGADLAVTGYVDKVSDALISLQLFVRDVKSGEMKKTMSAEIRGNTDENWLHGLRWLWRNRFAPEEKKN